MGPSGTLTRKAHDGPTLPQDRMEKQLTAPEILFKQFTQGQKHRDIAESPRRLLRVGFLMFGRSTLLTNAVGMGVWLWQFFCFAILRTAEEPGIYTILRVLKYAPLVYVGVVALELAAFTWWWLQGLRGRRHLHPRFLFPVYYALALFYYTFDDIMHYASPLRRAMR